MCIIVGISLERGISIFICFLTNLIHIPDGWIYVSPHAFIPGNPMCVCVCSAMMQEIEAKNKECVD